MKYRLSHYQYKHWEVQKKITSKNGDYWKSIKYPGNLIQAAQGLLDLAVDEVVTGDIKMLVSAVEEAEKRIINEIDKLIIERKKNG